MRLTTIMYKSYNRLQKDLRVIVLFFAMITAVPCSFAYANSYAQSTLLHLKAGDRTLKNLFEEIEENSEFILLYNDEAIDLSKKVNIGKDKNNINEILDEALLGSSTRYKIADRQIVLYKDENQSSIKINESQQQSKRRPVKGKVVDIKGESLPGVTVLVSGSTRGVSTDIDGTFTIEVENTEALVFKYLGMEEQLIAVGDKTVINVTMQEKLAELEGVTVVAFAKQKKESVVSSISTINPSELKVPSSNLTTAFAGKIAGVIAYQRSGEPGQDNAEFFVRGITTFGTGKKDPLILIDNVELSSNDLARLSPDDIASFSILKDAAATALYGARGANGVILVTTKEGKEGKLNVSFRFENSISTAAKDIEIADPITFMKLHNEAVRTRDPLAVLPYSDSEIDARIKGLNPYVYPVVDWKDMLFKDNTMNQRGNLSLSGGGNIARYYVALSYARDNGILSVDPVNNFNNNIQLNKYTVRSNINLDLTKTTELAIRVSGTFDDYQGPIAGGAEMYNNAIKSNPVLFPATYAPDKATQHLKHILFGNYGTAGYMNPYAEMLRGYKETETTVVIAQLEVKQDLSMITEGLRLRLMGTATRNSGYDVQRAYNPFYYSIGGYDKTTDVYTLQALNPESGTDYLNYSPQSKNVNSSLYTETSLAYDKVFSDIHNVSGMLVFTARESKSANESTLEKSLAGRNIGLAGRFTYGLLDRYFLEMNFGYNGSERFNKNNRWGFFPSAGFGWIVSKEKFWENSFLKDYIQMFKLKGTYGLVGNDAISDIRFFYLSQVNMNNGNYGYTFGSDFGRYLDGISISRYADDKIGWEESKKLNLGLEMRLFNALDLQVDYFNENRTNILQTRADIPSSMGLQSTPQANLGEAKANGFEATLDYSKFFANDIWLTVRGNFTYATSKYTLYEEPDYSDTPWLRKTGNKLGQQYGLIAERLFVDADDVANSPKQQFGEYMAGDIKYKDINRDGVVDQRDVVPIGYPTAPEIIYGFGFSAGVKGFDFSCFFQGSARSSFWINPNSGGVAPFVNSLPRQGNNAVLKFIEEDHWSESNPDMYAAWPRLSSSIVQNNVQTSTWFMRNGAFLRLKSLEFGYTIPSKISQKASMKDLRVYLSGTNLLCFSKFKLWDPEMGGSGLGYPVQRVFNIGVQCSF